MYNPGGRGFSECCFNPIYSGGRFIGKGPNLLLILLVTGSMMEGANPIGHIGTNMPSQKSKIFFRKKMLLKMNLCKISTEE